MVVACGVVDLVDCINYIHNVLNGYGLVGTKHHGGLGVIADFGIDEVCELRFVYLVFVNEVLELFVDVDGNGLFGHGLTAA